MTLPHIGREVKSVSTVLRTSGGLELPVTANFEYGPQSWKIKVSRGGEGKRGNGRKHKAIARLCHLDAAIELALQKGRAVHREVRHHPSRTCGPHAATEQVLPLLLPRKIQDGLYDYQRQGVAWLLRHERALLGDDMGLGKTAQALSAARRLIRSGQVAWVLVVVPRTLIANWVSESVRWAPELTISTAVFLGVQRAQQWERSVGRAHLLLTSYEQLRAPAEALIRNPPDLIIADEAHRLRNIGSLSTQGFRTINSKRLWALTGTPVERDAEDVAVLLSLLEPARFSRDDRHLPLVSLRSRLRPYLLRRKKQSVLRQLPQIVEKNEVLDLTMQQRRAYQRAIRTFGNSRSAAGILPLFTKLRAICDMDPDSEESSKLDRVCELIEDIKKVNEKAVVFSYVLAPIRSLEHRLRENGAPTGFQTVTGEMSLEERSVALREFKNDPNCHALLASTRVVSEGLTLTEANHVIFINLWWNPSSNAQARDRVVRIGQTRLVQVRSFTCRGTVEDRLEHLLREKSVTFEQLIESLSSTTADADELGVFSQVA